MSFMEDYYSDYLLNILLGTFYMICKYDLESLVSLICSKASWNNPN